MQSISFKVDNRNGRLLQAILDRPVHGEPLFYAVFAHCFTCGKDIFASKNIARELVSYGIGVVRFDFTGIGESDGYFEETTFTQNIIDLLSVVEYVSEHYAVPQLLIGHSLGGAIVIAASRELPHVKAVATIGSPYDPAHVAVNIQITKETEGEEDTVETLIGNRPFRLKKAFFEDLLKHRPNKPQTLNPYAALLVFHSPVDSTVDIDNARKIYNKAQHPKNFISLDKASHLLSTRKDVEFVAEMIAVWSRRHATLYDDAKKSRGSICR